MTYSTIRWVDPKKKTHALLIVAPAVETGSDVTNVIDCEGAACGRVGVVAVAVTTCSRDHKI